MPEERVSAPEAQPQITELLRAWGGGDDGALERLMPVVYSELRKLASNYMRRQNPGHTLQATALVNEAYLRLVDSSQVNWQNRTHFFAIAAQLMRRVLVDTARRKNSLKRGGENLRVTLDEGMELPIEKETDMVALDEALKQLAMLNPRHSRIVELRYFGGLTEEQTADILKISSRTVRRDWHLARAWLFRELGRN